MAALHDLDAPGKRVTRRSPVVVVSWDARSARVCAPATMTAGEVVAAVDRQLPTGLDHGWGLSDHDPRLCEQDAGRVHRLLVC